MAELVAIFLRPSARTPVRRVQTATAVADAGLTDDHAGSGRRQVTLLDLDAWRAAGAELGVDLDPAVRRANLVTSGLDLSTSIGEVIRIGDCRIEILGETRPCELLDAAAVGLCRVLRPAKRGGVFGRVLAGGTIATGDSVELLARQARGLPEPG